MGSRDELQPKHSAKHTLGRVFQRKAFLITRAAHTRKHSTTRGTATFLLELLRLPRVLTLCCVCRVGWLRRELRSWNLEVGGDKGVPHPATRVVVLQYVMAVTTTTAVHKYLKAEHETRVRSNIRHVPCYALSRVLS